jgi:hypothetical protein
MNYISFLNRAHIQNFEEKKLFQHFANLIKIRSTHLLPILDLIIPPLPEGGEGYTVLPMSVRPSKIFFVTFFSATIDGSLRGKLIKKNCKTKMVLPYTYKKPNKTVVIRKSHLKIFRSTHLLPILDLIIPPLPEGGGRYTLLPMSVRPSKKIIV